VAATTSTGMSTLEENCPVSRRLPHGVKRAMTQVVLDPRTDAQCQFPDAPRSHTVSASRRPEDSVPLTMIGRTMDNWVKL
jgi:hypothetical protein